MRKKIIFFFILSIILNGAIPTFSFAENVKNKNINLYIQENFKKEIYKPGDSDNLKFVIENNTDSKIKIKSLYFSKKDTNDNKSFNEMSKHTKVIIRNDNWVIIEDYLKNLLDNNKFKLNIEIEPLKSITFDMNIDIDKSMGNEAQNIYQELSINTDYEVYNNDYIENGNSENSEGNNTQNDNNNDQNLSMNILPQTGDNWNNSPIFAMIISAVIIIVISRKKNENKE